MDTIQYTEKLTETKRFREIKYPDDIKALLAHYKEDEKLGNTFIENLP